MHTADGNPASGFDFLIGEWNVAHRRLKHRLSGSADWESFGGHCAVRKVMSGQGNVDDNFIALPSAPYRAVTLRAFDSATGSWSIWWLDGRYPDRLDVPVTGLFRDGVGEFNAEDTQEGRRVRIRFLWTLPQPDAPRWAQAFSADGGATWETNWVMDFSRVRA